MNVCFWWLAAIPSIISCDERNGYEAQRSGESHCAPVKLRLRLFRHAFTHDGDGAPPPTYEQDDGGDAKK